MLKHKFYRWLTVLAAVVVTSVGAFAQTAPTKGVIRVKLQTEVARKVGKAPRMQANGVLQTGATPLDRAAKQVKALSIKRMIPYSPKFEAQHAAYGLDRWYEVTFDENFSVDQARKIFGAAAGVEISEAVTPMSLIEGNGNFRKVAAPALKANTALPFNDPRLSEQWHYQNFGTIPYSVAGADINLFNAWKVTTGSPDVIVAIIDGGVDYRHEDLARNMHANLAELNGTPGVDDDGNGYVDDVYGYNFCTNSAEIYPHSHGTHVAGTVAAVNNNGIGVSGVAGGDGSADSGVRMISCQVFDSRSGTPEANYAAAIVYAADAGASIAQCSWGWDGAGYKEQAVLDAIDYFTKASRTDRMNGGLCIFAAGNNGENGEYYPAAYEPCLAVGAMTSELTPASYSNRGPWVDVTAPGGLLDYGTLQGVLSTLPNNEYGYNEGTSMATPHVSGIAALILSKFGSPTFVNESLRTQLVTSVNDFYGFGNNSSVNGLFGSGYIDAAKALSLDAEGVPEAVADFDIAAGQDYMQLTWTIPASSDNNVNHHIIYYSTEPFTAASDLSKVATSVADTKFLSSGQSYTHEVAGLKALTTYYVAIAAVNRWGRASELSAVKSVTTNAGPKMTVDQSSLTLATTADAPVATATLSIGNEAEGLLKWQAGKRTVQAQLQSVKRPVVNAVPYAGKLGNQRVRKAAATVLPDYEAADYPQDIANYDLHWANIGDTDTSLPNSMAQWFHVDASEFPNGFNLTHISAEGNYGTNPRIEIYKGDVAISSASLLQEVNYQFWVYNYNIALNEQLYFAPGESFWVVIHFDGGQEGYPLGMGRSERTDLGNTAYMSNDLGKTWTQLATALKGSSYEPDAAHFTWAIKARSLNPDWSKALDINPAQGTVKQGETQTVEVSADGSKFVNGTYKLNVLLTGNESDNPVHTVGVNLSVKGNAHNVVMPKVVNFGNLLVGESKTLTVEAYNAGYGSFRGSQYSAGVYSNAITSSSEHFAGPDYLQAGFPARTKVPFEVTYTPTAAGSHTGTISFTDADGKQVRVIVQGSATDPAKLHVEPAVIDAGTLEVGTDPKEVKFTVTNQGKYPLEYVFPKFSDEQIDGAKGANHKFGYTVFSTLPGFNAMEYTADGGLIGATDISAKFSDAVYVSDAINPGFSFPYYGKNYDRLYITSYGGIMFAQNEENFWAPLTETSTSLAGTGMICAYGRQLMLNPQSKIEYARKDGKFVVRFSNVLAVVYDQDYTPVSFRIELSANGDIEIYYDNIEAEGTFQSGSTLFCGINDPAMTDAITLTSADMADYWGNETVTAENSRYKLFNSGTAVRFEAPKASFVTALSAPYGIVSPDETVEITATLAANADMDAGETFNNLAIVTNDPQPEVSAVRVNATIAGDMLVAVAALEDEAIDFGNVFRTANVQLPVTVKNIGHNALTVTAVTAEAGKVTVADQQLPLTVKPGMSKDFVVTLPTETEGAVADKVTVTTDAGTLTATVTGTVIGCPTVDLSDEQYTETVNSGDPLAKTLTVANNGNEALTYSITPDALVRMAIPERDDTHTSYVYSSSLDDTNVKYEWVDIETNGLGTQNTFSYYNLHDYVEVELPFEFPFYGQKYTKMYVYNTGFVSFTKRHDDRIWPEPPADFPEGTVFTNIIAPYWGLHSMDTSKTAGTFHYVTDDRAVVSFMEYGNSMNIGVCYQLILEKDGSFRFQYKGANETSIIYGMFGMAGISNADATHSIKLPERMVAFNNAVSFKPVKENTLAAGAKDEIALDFDTNRMGGVYTTALQVATNVPGKESIEIPVQLTVNGVAKPQWPDNFTVEQPLMYQSTDYSNPLVQMGAAYDAPFTVANNGTAAFTIVNIAVGGPQIYDEWFDMYSPAFMLFANLPELDWMTGEPTGNNMWQQYYEGTPVEVGNSPVQFSLPMLQNEFWATPGTYEVPLTFTVYNGSLAQMSADDDPAYEQKEVMVTFVVTPMPVLALDKQEIYVKAETDDQKTVETLTIASAGEYKLTYSLRLDPTGVGEVIEDAGGGIAPWSKRNTLSAEQTALLQASIAPVAKPLAKSTNSYDTPQGFTYDDALFYPAMPGSTEAYNYGSQNTYDVYKASTYFKAPAAGFNISHVYMPVFLGGATNYNVKIEVIAGSDPAGETVLGQGNLFIDKQSSLSSGVFYTVALDKPVYMNGNEEFCLVATYDAGATFPAYLCKKEEAVVEGRYQGWTQQYGWFDIGSLFKDQYGSLGYIMSCLQTTPGSPWVELLDAATEGVVEVGETAEVKVAVNAASARLEKQNTAILVIKTNDPSQPVVNFPIVLDKNGRPVVEATQTVVYAKEGETSEVAVTVSDPDMDDLLIRFEDATEIAKLSAVEASATDAATVTRNDDGTYTVSGATEPVTVKVAVAADYGQAGDGYAFVVGATDTKGHETQATVRYSVEHVNRAPALVAEDTEVSVAIDGISHPVNFAELFTEPDGDELTFAFEMAANDVAEAYTTATGAVFAGKKAGTAKAKVTATDPEGLSAVATVTVNVSETGGVDDIEADAAGALVSLVENPVTEAIRLLAHTDSQATVALYDASGAMVANVSTTLVNGSVTTLAAPASAGIYLLKVTAGAGTQVLRVVCK